MLLVLLNYNNAVVDQHRWMIPVMGVFFLIIYFLFILMLVSKPDQMEPHLNKLQFSLIIWQLFFSMFFFVNDILWEYGILVGMFSLLGLYGCLTGKKDFIFWYFISSLVFFLGFLGFLTGISGFENIYNGIDQGVLGSCVHFYFLNPTTTAPFICSYYLVYLRVICYTMILIQPLQAFIAYYLWHENKATPLRIVKTFTIGVGEGTQIYEAK